MTDTELLELAARAAGYTVVRWSDDGDALLLEGVQEPWSSLASDGDAFRLAVALNLFNHPLFAHFLALERFANQDQDDCTAHRRAFTRAAAAIAQERGE